MLLGGRHLVSVLTGVDPYSLTVEQEAAATLLAELLSISRKQQSGDKAK